jgi:hypothetical protein
MLPIDIGGQPGSRPDSRFCIAGAASGIVVELRFKNGGEDLEGKSFVLSSPPEMWIISIRHLANDKKAGESAERVADSIKINDQPIQLVESPVESLTGDWNSYTLVPGLLSASAPSPWREVDINSVALDSQIPCRPEDARYFYCQCASASLIIGTGSCYDDQQHPMHDDLSRAQAGGSKSEDAMSSPSPQVDVLLGRQALVWSKEHDVQDQKWISRKVLAVDGHRVWLLVADYPANDHSCAELVKRVQGSMEER